MPEICIKPVLGKLILTTYLISLTKLKMILTWFIKLLTTIQMMLTPAHSRCLPSGKDGLTLANDFADFFFTKINNIRIDIENDQDVDKLLLRHSLHTENEGDGFFFYLYTL